MFDKVVFAGGGHRCWWQAGFWEGLRAEIELQPRVIGGVSMGAFMACLVHANDTRRALSWFERELSGVRTNIALTNLFRKDAPLFRQGVIYRKALRALLGGEHFRQLMWQAPEIRVAYAVAPSAMTDRQLAMHAWGFYRHDGKPGSRPLHPGRKASDEEGADRFRPEIKSLQDCGSDREMIELLMASSAIPPMFTPVELEGERAVSGELVDPVPVQTVQGVVGPTLVLTTRAYDRRAPVFASEGRIYVRPSSSALAASWDFTSPGRFAKLYDLGRRDAESFLQLFGLGGYQRESAFAGMLLGGDRWPGEQAGAGAADTPDAQPRASGGEAAKASDDAASAQKAAERGSDARAQASAAAERGPDVHVREKGVAPGKPDVRAREKGVAAGKPDAYVPEMRAAEPGLADAAQDRSARALRAESDDCPGEQAPKARSGEPVSNAGSDDQVANPRTEELDPITVGELSDKLFERGKLGKQRR